MSSLLLAGCGGNSDELVIVPIEGTVRYKGEPVPDLMLNFQPVKGRPSWAITDAQGKYKAVYTEDRPGVLAGECRVQISLKPATPDEELQMLEGTHPRQVALQDPLKKYGGTTTGLVLTISPDRTTVDIAID
ncbi:MAG: hypothetical protein KDA66_14965 [Planctomycetaceae bacterium]|nr:hypothetical protein [Planctomycetaceae bacterium]